MSLEDKKKSVKKIDDLIKKFPIIGVVNMHALPTAQLQRMRTKLRGSVELLMIKKRVIKRALEKIKGEKKNIEQLEPFLKGMPALLFSNENPFKLASIIKKNKSKAAAKPGQKAPNDITISAGPTPFQPGPIISELGSLGLKTKVQNGKIEILKDAVVAKEGDVITNELSSLLVRLGIEPMEIGLDLVAVYENGQVFTKAVLNIDEEEYFDNFTQAERWAFNLAVDAGIITDATSVFLIQKAFKEAKSLALEANILADAVLPEVLAKAESGMQQLNKQLNLPPKTEKKSVEENKKEEVVEQLAKEEVKVEVKQDVEQQQISEKIEESKGELQKKTTDEKVNDMVDAWKKKEEKKPSADEIVKSDS